MKHAFAGSTWLVAHTRPGRFGGGRDTALRPLDLNAPMLGSVTPSDFSWNVLASFDACIQCGRCEQACPAFAAGQRLNPKALVQGLVHAMGGAPAYKGSPAPLAPAVSGAGGMHHPIVGADASIHPDTLWACTTCRACVQECPMMIEHVDAIVDMRRGQALMHGAVRPGAARALRTLRDTGNLAGRPPAERADALAMLDVPVLAEGGETDILLWLGDGAFERRYGQSLQALVKLMQRAGLRFAILGEAETDCGDLARRLGDEATFQALAHDVIATLAVRRFSRIVTADPHAFHALANEYPALGGAWQVQHHTALLDELVDAGRLKLSPQATGTVAWHDPCYLARYNGQVDAPRRLLRAACQNVVEMERHGLRAMCCGGGGGNPVSDVDAQERIPDLRMAQARQVGAQMVAVGCPGCTAMLEGVVGDRPEVRDIAELVLDAVVAS
ncbi:MAG: (Fe-S)-binding protein [Acetobacter sp.]